MLSSANYRFGSPPARLDVPVVVARDERLATTTLCLAVGYGARDDPPGEGGTAHLLEHLLMAAPLDGGSSLCERVERLGGEANAETGLDLMLFTAQVHHRDAADILPLLCRAVLDPVPAAQQFAIERDVVLQELAAAEADPSDTVQDAFLARLFAGTALASPVGGDRQGVSALTITGVMASHKILRSRPYALVVVGPTLPTGIEPGPAAVRPYDTLALLTPPVETAADTAAWPAEFCWLCVGSRAPGAYDDRRHAFTVLATLLGSSPSSMLYRLLRNENALAYAFQAWHRGYAETGAWRVLVGVEPQNGPKVLDLVRSTLGAVAAGRIDANDLVSARRQATMQLVRDAEIPWERARQLALNTRCGARTWAVENEVAALERVTIADLRDAAATVLADLVTVVRPAP